MGTITDPLAATGTPTDAPATAQSADQTGVDQTGVDQTRVDRTGVDAAVLDELCPYFVVTDRALAPIRVGAVLGRLLPDLLGRGSLLDAFDVRRPRGATSFDAIAAHGHGRLALLDARHLPGLTLRGQFCVLHGGQELLFFGAPVATTLKDLTDLGLALDDLPPHSAVADYLLLAQTQATTAIEAKAMAERLRALNSQLEVRVAERTRKLQAGNARLARYSSELEKMSSRLQHEIAERTRIEAERAQMEAELRLAHKLEAVGQLASGIAHEINTPVQFVGDNLRFMADAVADVVRALQAQLALASALDDTPLDDTVAAALTTARAVAAETDLEFALEELPRAVGESLEGLDRVGHIVRALKEFADPDGGDHTYADLNDCVGTTLVVSTTEYADVADVVTDLAADLPQVRCIPGEINQVILHLLVNAAHAVADRHAGTATRGTITIRTRRDGDHAEIVVADTGTGIPDAVRARIFDPFFTTKEVGRGSGQGLSTCRAIVTIRHGGQLDVTSQPGVGSEFTVRLPLAGPSRPEP